MTKLRAVFALALCAHGALADSGMPDLHSVAPDLIEPPVELAAPAPGRRVYATTRGWQDTALFHTIYLPSNWQPGGKHPVIVEYAGNGRYSNAFGDVSDGSVEQCRIGFGVSAGRDYIWLALPFVGVTTAGRGNRAVWWGDADETAQYCVETVRAVCREFGGDPQALVLAGFSRGSIAANYIGLRNDQIAPLWRAFICHSHYDGVIERWPYADADAASALVRLQRLGGRPQFISHEGSTLATQLYLQAQDVPGDFTFHDFTFRNHTDLWALRDTALRRAVRRWLGAQGLPAPPEAGR